MLQEDPKSKRFYDINFKVDDAFRREFKVDAAQSGMSMVAFLKKLHAIWKKMNPGAQPRAGEATSTWEFLQNGDIKIVTIVRL